MQALQDEDTGALCQLHHDLHARKCMYVRTKYQRFLEHIQNMATKQPGKKKKNKVNPYCVVLVKKIQQSVWPLRSL